MTKLDIVNQVSEITGLSKVETELTFEAIACFFFMLPPMKVVIRE